MKQGGLIPGALSSHGKAKLVVKRLFGPEVTRSTKGGQFSRPLSTRESLVRFTNFTDVMHFEDKATREHTVLRNSGND